MNKIEVKVLNQEAVSESEKIMVAMARLTQRGHSITSMKDFEELLDKPYTNNFVNTLVELPHPTLQKFGIINIMVVGASRRFLAQITRHQNEVKFMSGSLQYSDYSGAGQFCVPYEIIEADYEEWVNDWKKDPKCAPPGYNEKLYLNSCATSLMNYRSLAKSVGHDAAGYAMPQGLRNVLLISATPYQIKHMISQRTCNRNSLETQYVTLLIWEQLFGLSIMFEECGPFCTKGPCPEGKMRCKNVLGPEPFHPTCLLDSKFRYIRGVNQK